MMISPQRPLVLVGAGKMGGAMLTGWLESGVAPDLIVVIDPALEADSAAALARRGVRTHKQAPAGIEAGVLALAVKPQIMAEVLPAVAQLRSPTTTVLSVAAGITIGKLAAGLGDGPIVRTIPNTPCQIGKGVIGAVGNAAADGAIRDEVTGLLSSVGAVYWLGEEAEIDAVTAVSGSGPAYVYYLTECLAAAGRAVGLDAALAADLARGTVAGASALMEASPSEPAQLRRNVTSPGGTTAAALDVLMKDGALERLLTEAIRAAALRSRELGG